MYICTVYTGPSEHLESCSRKQTRSEVSAASLVSLEIAQFDHRQEFVALPIFFALGNRHPI